MNYDIFLHFDLENVISSCIGKTHSTAYYGEFTP